jgi:hypothetical protein
MERGRFKMIWNKVKLFLPVVLGAVGGFLYYNYIGCNGSCAITSSPVNSTVYGAVIGLVLTDWKKIRTLIFYKRKGAEK